MLHITIDLQNQFANVFTQKYFQNECKKGKQLSWYLNKWTTSDKNTSG